MKVKSPPDFNGLINKYSDNLLEIILEGQSKEQSLEYVHWNKIYRKYATEEAEKNWLCLKMSRGTHLKNIDLSAQKNGFFKFYETDLCKSIVHEIETLHTKLSAFRTDKTSHLVDSLIMEESIASSQLEGAATTRIVAKQMLEQERKPKNKDEQMIVNNYHLMMKTLYTKDTSLSVNLIKSFHKTAMSNINKEGLIPGEFRTDNNVYVTDAYNEILYTPPSHELLNERLDKVCKFANHVHDGKEGRKFIHPVIKAIILHFMIAYEHPFVDGNGRTARAVFYWYMLKHGYNDFKYISISKLLKAAPAKYARSYIYTETDDNDLTYFLEYQLSIISRAINELMQYLVEKTSSIREMLEALQNTKLADKLNTRQLILVKKAIKEPGRIFTANEVKNDLGVSINTARTYLKGLVKEKILFETKSGQEKIYISARDISSLLKD